MKAKNILAKAMSWPLLAAAALSLGGCDLRPRRQVGTGIVRQVEYVPGGQVGSFSLETVDGRLVHVTACTMADHPALWKDLKVFVAWSDFYEYSRYVCSFDFYVRRLDR